MALNRQVFLCAGFALAAWGCGHSDGGRSIVGEWAVYSPLANGVGTITFTQSTFTEEIPRQGRELEIKGSYTQSGNTLQMRIDPSSLKASGIQVAGFTEDELLVKAALEWSGSDIAYLTAKDSVGKQQAAGTLALARNGAKPDLSRLNVSVSVLGGPDSNFRLPDESLSSKESSRQLPPMPTSPPASSPQSNQDQTSSGQGDATQQGGQETTAGDQDGASQNGPFANDSKGQAGNGVGQGESEGQTP